MPQGFSSPLANVSILMIRSVTCSGALVIPAAAPVTVVAKARTRATARRMKLTPDTSMAAMPGSSMGQLAQPFSQAGDLAPVSQT